MNEKLKISIDKMDIVSAIKKNNPIVDDHYAELMANKIINEGDGRLEPNLREWINGEPISDLWIGKYCINAIMKARDDNDFLDAFLAMSLYLKDESAGVLKIWQGKK